MPLSKANTVDREAVTPSTPPSQSTEYREPNETEAFTTQRSLLLQEDFVLLHSKDADLPETRYGTVTAHSASLNLPNPHTPCTDLVSHSNRNIMTSLERPPASGDFEWDERNDQPGGQKFVDGMASLTSDTDGSGYLGMVLFSYTRLFQISIQTDTDVF